VTSLLPLADPFGFLVFVMDFLPVVGFSSTVYMLDYDKTTGVSTLVSFSPLLYILNRFDILTPILPSTASLFLFFFDFEILALGNSTFFS
jgi:hypothetical protein